MFIVREKKKSHFYIKFASDLLRWCWKPGQALEEFGRERKKNLTIYNPAFHNIWYKSSFTDRISHRQSQNYKIGSNFTACFAFFWLSFEPDLFICHIPVHKVTITTCYRGHGTSGKPVNLLSFQSTSPLRPFWEDWAPGVPNGRPKCLVGDLKQVHKWALDQGTQLTVVYTLDCAEAAGILVCGRVTTAE